MYLFLLATFTEWSKTDGENQQIKREVLERIKKESGIQARGWGLKNVALLLK